jgi:hypothetical protein
LISIQKDDYLKPVTALLAEFDFSWGHGVSSDSPLKIAISLAVNELFSDQQGLAHTASDAAYQKGYQSYQESPLAWQALVQGQYQSTQEYLKQCLPEDRDYLIGFRLAEDHSSLNPLASFTLTNQGLSEYVDHCLANNNPSNRYWHASIPVQRIFSFENVGAGENWQKEIIVIGSNKEDDSCYSEDHSLVY